MKHATNNMQPGGAAAHPREYWCVARKTVPEPGDEMGAVPDSKPEARTSRPRVALNKDETS